MRLINFGPGEIADRLTILALKRAYGLAAGKGVEHFERERNALLTLFPAAPRTRWLETYTELAAVNAQIWSYTDEVRNPLTTPMRLSWLALALLRTNDRRAELITLINLQTGNIEEGAEKI